MQQSILDPASCIRDPGSWTRVAGPGSGIMDPSCSCAFVAVALLRLHFQLYRLHQCRILDLGILDPATRYLATCPGIPKSRYSWSRALVPVNWCLSPCLVVRATTRHGHPPPPPGKGGRERGIGAYIFEH